MVAAERAIVSELYAVKWRILLIRFPILEDDNLTVL